MALTESTLSTQLQNLAATTSEATAITALTDAYGVYAADAVSNAVTLSTAGVNRGKAAMSAALVGMSASGAGLTKIPLAIAAFWNAVAGGLATSFTGATAIVPPPHASLPTTFPDTCGTNTSGQKTLAQSAAAIAGVMHADAIVGGSVTFPGPITAPIL